ncbi:hypothetical protein LTR37_015023 [Vermiconidia calcicola]|uniref:Uncharacterized protein n=1 Tax=Vermiconidia calcicola TaxID=1690605 RepID=A0ACC3MT98_9PEZI|nr:hypothetical protein LTR37_015023 [Vermiconidia calcicola]
MKKALQARTATSVVEAEACFFFEKLPRELRDQIYREAYPTDVHLLNSRRYHYWRDPNQSPSALLVSRQYYEEAFPIVVRQTNFKYFDGNQPDAFIEIVSGAPTWRENIVSLDVKYTLRREADRRALLKAIKSCPRLEYLTLTLDPRDPDGQKSFIDGDSAAIEEAKELREFKTFKWEYLGKPQDYKNVTKEVEDALDAVKKCVTAPKR